MYIVRWCSHDGSLQQETLPTLDLAIKEAERLRQAGYDGVEADLRGANLRGATHVETAIVDNHTLFFSMQCPESGSYTGFKKAGGLIVQLEIPADALRSSATSRKCRASKAFVVSITDMDGNPAGDRVESDYDKSFVYTVGEFIEVKDFDTDRWNECAPGIHHYITRAEAVRHI